MADGFSGVTDAHVKRYCEEGYLLVRSGFGGDATDAALAAIDRMCAEDDPRFARACRGGVFDPERASVGKDDPGIQFEAAGAGLPKGQRANYVRKLKWVYALQLKLFGDRSRQSMTRQREHVRCIVLAEIPL